MKKRIVILYGSQTGTARETAEGLWRQSKLFGYSGPVMAMDEYDAKSLIDETAAVFVCSTTGVGEEPDNMKAFWKFLLRKSLPAHSLRDLSFAVLGLGDSTYAKFNFPAKKLHKRLVQLGATPIADVGLCDYQHDLGHDAVADPWTLNLWSKLKEIFPGEEVEPSREHLIFVPRWEITSSKNQTTAATNSFTTDNVSKETLVNSFVMKLASNDRITAEDHFQDVRMLKFDIVDHSIDYKPGDVLYVKPKNSKEMVDRFFRIFQNHELNLMPEDKIDITPIYHDMPIPKELSKTLLLKNIVEEYWDLSSIPKKYAFSVLGYFSKHELEKNKCVEFCTPEGQEELFNYCNRPRRNILEVLEDFHRSTTSLTLQALFEIFTCIKPRPFSIASSCQATNGKQIDLLIAVVKYYTKLKSERLGLCSNWLKNLTVGEKTFAWIKPGTFKFPNEKDIPIIMIGPGTGLAPFRNLIMEKECLDEASYETLILYFGCRNKNADFHCGDYLKRMEENKKLTLLCAFSRDQEEKIYVQHKIRDSKKIFWNWISDKKAFIYIAGSSKDMPDGVKNSIIENVMVKEGKMTKEEAENTIKEMENLGRLQMETW